MRQSALQRGTILLACAAVAGCLAGCRVSVDKDARGEDKKVQIDTPFGGIHVNTDQMTAADLGLPVYPGAQEMKGDDNHKSADVHMGFGEWEMRVRAVSYATTDKQDDVVAFYKKALGRYGDVIVCQNRAAVGKPDVTTEGLDCTDKGGPDVKVNDHGQSFGFENGHGDLQLKAGSKRHQHIVGFESPKDGQTRFALVALDLPAAVEGDKGNSN